MSESLAPTVLVVDNYDSFAYNLVQYVGEVVLRLGGGEDDVVVCRNDAITVEDVRALDPDGVVVSPGPGTPQAAGISMPTFAELDYPTLGVCLGHQALCAANGSQVGHADAVVHGKSSLVTHDGEGVFEGVPDPVEVGRYHSLAVDRDALPDVLEETAHTVEAAEADIMMAVRHHEAPHVGVQFHPESIRTEGGKTMVENFCLQCTT
ncbi:anthranilate/aminodeoxychorismate synthase component II [Halobacteriales archaeon QS_6_64_34]|nr:MAG: anthranilate/aminodeoxychorismate synthase component II [Halobacteriales archaeon QS_6_64_34]